MHNESAQIGPPAFLSSALSRTAVFAALLIVGITGASSSVAIAQQTSSNEPQELALEEIVVTAEKSNRSLQNTSTSIAVFSDEDLLRSPGLDSTADLYSRIANVTIQGKSGTLPAVRGVDGTGAATGGSAAVAGTRSRLAIQLDGRPLSQQDSVYGANTLWDVQQVEALRGPQSTLQGRNAIAGTIAIRTKDPTFDWQGGLRLVGGSDDYRQGSFYVSGPLVDEQLAFRVAYDRSEFDSFLKMPVSYPGVAHPERFDMETVRAKLLIQPKAMQGFQTVLTLNHMKFSGPQSELVGYPFDDHLVFRGYMERFQPRTTSAIAATTWKLDDRFTFENTLSYSDYEAERASFPGDGNGNFAGYDMVIEPRLRFASASGRARVLAGIYHFRDSHEAIFDLSLYVGPAGLMSFDDTTTDTAAFAQLDYALSDRFEVTLGGRVEREHRQRFGGSDLFIVDLDETYKSFLPKLGAAWHLSEKVTVGAVVSRAYNGGGAGFTFQPPFVNYTYKPEYAWNYETYWRAKVSERLFLTGNVFFSDYKDYQLEFDLNPDPQIFAIAVDNGQVETYGVELGARWLAAPGLKLSADVGYLRGKVVDFTGEVIDGNELQRAPRWSGRLAAGYAHTSGFDFAVDASYSSPYYVDVTNPPRGRSQAYWIANAQAGFTWGKIRVFGSVENLFDDDAYTGITPGVTPQGDLGHIQHPRAYRVGLMANF